MFDITYVISWTRKNISKTDVLIIFTILTLFGLTRLVNLDRFPIFTDEGIYIRWAKVAWHDATWRFISLTDGRQPLQTWAMIPFLKMFPDNALLAGRLLAVSSGLLTLSGLWTTAFYLFGKRTAHIAGVLYVVTPMFLFHDRMALVDSTVNAGVVAIFFLGIVLARLRRIDVALILGVVAGFSLLAKSSVKLFFGLSLISGIFILIEQKQSRVSKLVSFCLLYICAGIVALVIYNVQRLSSFFHFVAIKNNTFVLSFSELLNNPFQLFFKNLPTIPYFVFSEMAFVIPILGMIGMAFVWKKFKPEFLYLFLWLMASYGAIALVAKVIFPRYLMSLGVLLLLPASYLLAKVHDKYKVGALWLMILASVVYYNYTIIFAPARIPFPEVDRGQYIEGWPAGLGIKDIIDYARDRSKGQKIKILAEGNFGMSADVLDAHLKTTDTNIEIAGYWPLDLNFLEENRQLARNQNVLVVFSHRSEFPQHWPIKLIKKYSKPNNKSAIYLYELTH